MDMFLSECLNDANEMTRHGGFARAQWVLTSLPRSPATTCDEMWVFFEHVVMDRKPMVHSLVTEQRHVKHLYDGTVVNESDVLLCEKPRPWLDPTKLET